MKQRLQLNIPEPCHEDWNNMTGTQQGRFCMSCQKEVIDFSVMSDKEILNYISTASSNMCGRVADGQLNRHLIMPREPKKIWWRYWMHIAASFLLLSSKTNAQVKTHKPQVTVPKGKNYLVPESVVAGAIAYTPEYKRKLAVHGRVVDDKNNPVSFASIKMKNNVNGATADVDGYFVLYAKPDLDELVLHVSSVGYKPTDVDLSNRDEADKKIKAGNIVLMEQKMDTVVVLANNPKCISGIAGGISVAVKTSRFEKVKSQVKNILAVNEIKIYPNPISAGSVFNIRFNIKEPGEYAVQFTDASGKIITTRQLNITGKNQLESFDGSVFNGHGVYFVSVTNRQSLKTFTAKLMVQ